MTPAHSRAKHYEVEDRLEALRKYSNSSKLNRIEMGDTQIGIITSGISYEYCREVLGDNASYLKIGFAYPLPDELIREFAAKVDKLYVVEENDPFLEDAIKAMGI